MDIIFHSATRYNVTLHLNNEGFRVQSLQNIDDKPHALPKELTLYVQYAGKGMLVFKGLV